MIFIDANRGDSSAPGLVAGSNLASRLEFVLLESQIDIHRIPEGVNQRYVYYVLRRDALRLQTAFAQTLHENLRDS